MALLPSAHMQVVLPACVGAAVLAALGLAVLRARVARTRGRVVPTQDPDDSPHQPSQGGSGAGSGPEGRALLRSMTPEARSGSPTASFSQNAVVAAASSSKGSPAQGSSPRGSSPLAPRSPLQAAQLGGGGEEVKGSAQLSPEQAAAAGGEGAGGRPSWRM